MNHYKILALLLALNTACVVQPQGKTTSLEESSQLLIGVDLMNTPVPCNHLAGYNPQHSDDTLYLLEVKSGSKSALLTFECRYVNTNTTNKHAVLIGSPADCASRNFDYEHSVFPHLRKFANLCSGRSTIKLHTTREVRH